MTHATHFLSSEDQIPKHGTQNLIEIFTRQVLPTFYGALYVCCLHQMCCMRDMRHSSTIRAVALSCSICRQSVRMKKCSKKHQIRMDITIMCGVSFNFISNYAPKRRASIETPSQALSRSLVARNMIEAKYAQMQYDWFAFDSTP